MAPTCSIVVPVYNDAGLLAETLASVRAQTITDWEAIVVDDGSRDPSTVRDVVAATADARIRIVRLDANAGPAVARNAGIRAATADVILTLDADDHLEPAYLERVLPLFDPASPVNCAFTEQVAFGAVDAVIRPDRNDVLALLRWQWIPQSGVAIRRSLWEAVGGYWEDEAVRVGDEDREFWIAAIGAGLHPAYLPEPLLRYRVGHASLTARLNQEAWRTHRAIYDRHRELYRQHGGGRGFLADGYVGSAEAVRALGMRRRAIRLALGALRIEPWRLDAYGVLGRAILPRRLHESLRRLRRGAAGGSA